MSAMHALTIPALPSRAWSITPTRIVALFTTVMVGVVVVLWGAIAMQGPPGNPYGPPQGGGYGSAPENPYGPAPGPREAPPPEIPGGVPPEPPNGSGNSSACTGADCDLSGCDCDANATACVFEALCESLSLCDVLAACSTGARAGTAGLAFAQLLVPIGVLVAWRKRERRREAAA
jgi:hypothetical protein